MNLLVTPKPTGRERIQIFPHFAEIDDSDRQSGDPTPAEIMARAHAIRCGWSDSERQSRRQIGKQWGSAHSAKMVVEQAEEAIEAKLASRRVCLTS